MNNSIAEKNDQLRKNMFQIRQTEGKCLITQGISNLNDEDKAKVLTAVRNDNTFTEDNDPSDEHDFGVIEIPGIPKAFWKIDYFKDETMQFGAEDAMTSFRVLTIMLATEY